MEELETKTSPQSSEGQFKISSLLWITFFIAAIMSYLLRITPASGATDWWCFLVDGAVYGGIVGLLTRRFKDGIFWSVLISSFGFISVASDPVSDMFQRWAWSAVGAAAGAIGATVFVGNSRKSWIMGTLITAAVSGIVMFVYHYFVFPFRGFNVEVIFDMCAAPVIGGLVAIIIRTILWLESERPLPRYITATWLLVVVIAGNLIARW